MKSGCWWAAILIVPILSLPVFAKGSGSHASLDRIGSGPGSERVDADRASAGKTKSLPSTAKQAVRREAKNPGKNPGKN